MKRIEHTVPMGWYQRKAHEEADYIFQNLLPKHGLKVREEQLRLCHEMLDTLWGNHIALCDAGVGIGKTYAYLAACILQEKYREKSRGISETSCRPAVISTSSIALQEAIMQEYIPFLSRILLEEKLIRIPLKAAVRKGKEHFVCDSRLEQRLLAIRGKRKNEEQRQALRALRTCYDMDQVHGLSGFDRRLVCVPRFCPRNCLGKETCRYHRYMERAKGAGIHFQICNHNYLLADASHRAKGYRPLLSDYRALVVDEAHKLPEAAGQMCGKTLCHDDILELCFLLEKEHQGIRAGRLKSMMKRLFQVIAANHTFEQGQRVAFRQTEECVSTIKEGAAFLFEMGRRCRGSVSKWIRDRLEEAGKLLCCFLFPDRKYILFLEQDPQRLPVFCTASREVPAYLQEMLWNQGVPAILTSGTLKAGAGFGRTRQMLGLSEKERKRKPKVEEYVAESPFEYKRNCMLYLPQDGKRLRHGSREEAAWIAEKVRQLTCATHGHTLVLFTSYSLMGSVYQILRKSLSFPLVEVWRHTQEEIMRFKKMNNAVLFAAGSCWEGVDFPGDRVSSLIIVRLPFAVPDPVWEAEKERYGNLREYIDAVAVPDMQKKLRQGFGRAIRTETDTCVVTILDHRAARGGRYYEDVLSALPPCEMAESIEDVGRFIGKRKNIDYYM
ncbi:ATP-dependent DNA helicase [Schaedlerella sp.]|uniref:ATP-dependent DNA helicase n=1 Tax=Schaedlerella sp. TaxID=2676057 RepID=UPI003529663E